MAGIKDMMDKALEQHSKKEEDEKQDRSNILTAVFECTVRIKELGSEIEILGNRLEIIEDLLKELCKKK